MYRKTILASVLLSAIAVCGQLTVHAEPLIQNSEARSSIDLNGEWHIIVDPYENGFYNHRFEEYDGGYFKNRKAQHPSDLIEYDFSTSESLAVPGDWNSQSEQLFFYEGTVWYFREFAVRPAPGKRYVVHFGAVNYETFVYVNGEKVGQHEGGFTAFQFDVTSHLKDGENFIVLKVDNRRERDNVPTVNTDWWNYGGITRSVKLLELDESYLLDYSVQLHPTEVKRIQGWVQLGGTLPGQNSVVTVAIPDLGVAQSVDVNTEGFAEIELEAQPELWSPGSPTRYDVHLTYSGTTIVDQIGFRRIDVAGEDILLNGEPIYLRGISIHEEAPTREGRAWSEEDARTTLTWAKELGCNFVRLAHYPHNEAMVRMADEMGLLVWSEIPVYWTIQFEKEYVYDKAEQQLEEMISRDRNRAAVVLWSVANETPNQEARYKFLSRLVDRARELDSTRLITAALDTQTRLAGLKKIEDSFAAKVDVIGINAYCGWYGNDKPQDCAGMRWESDYNKPVIISEFGAGALQGKHGEEYERWTEEYQAAVYEHNLTMIENMSFVRGMTPWILKDFRSPRRPLPAIQDYWNRKGLVSETGERKRAWYLLRDFYQAKVKAE